MMETPVVIVHDDVDFTGAIRFWLGVDAPKLKLRAFMRESGLNGTTIFNPEVHYILVKCHTIWKTLPPICTVIHDGDLSKYRGCSPMRHAVSRGEKEIVVTAFEPTDILDWGPIRATYVLDVPTRWQPFSVLWARSARAYAHLIRKIALGHYGHYAPPPTMGTVYKRWGPDREEFDPRKQTSSDIYWGLRACGPPHGLPGVIRDMNDYGTVVWAETGGDSQKYGLGVGEWHREIDNIYQIGCVDGRTIRVELNDE